ncbi:MAG: hypothetical protein HC892_04705 [Saprospiraceae bacterium]|nr:hypothetical protein [Saprospiraceae bacterium]
MKEQLNIILSNISNIAQIILVANIILYLLNRKQLNLYIKWFDVFLVVSLVTEIVAAILFKRKIPNLHVLHIYTLVEFIVLSLFYVAILQKIIAFRTRRMYWFIALVSILIVLNSIFIQLIDTLTFNSYAKTLTQVIFIAYAVLYFFIAPIENNPKSKLLDNINSAILFYYAASLFIFMGSNLLSKLDDYHRIFWITNAIFYLVFQLIVCYALWQFQKTTKILYT